MKKIWCSNANLCTKFDMKSGLRVSSQYYTQDLKVMCHSFRCFITNPYAALGGVIVPVLLLLLVVAIVFVKAFQVTPQWQAYDDIYRGRYNIKGKTTLSYL